jgi:hypothetical protein
VGGSDGPRWTEMDRKALPLGAERGTGTETKFALEIKVRSSKEAQCTVHLNSLYSSPFKDLVSFAAAGNATLLCRFIALPVSLPGASHWTGGNQCFTRHSAPTIAPGRVQLDGWRPAAPEGSARRQLRPNSGRRENN